MLLGACGETAAVEEKPEAAEAENPAPETEPEETGTAPEESEAAEAPEETWSAAEPWEAEAPEITVPEGAVRVETVDELLAAIAPGATIVLAPGTYDLSTAADYGKTASGAKYRWEEVYDGYQLVLENLDGLQILAPEGAEIQVLPRYANVLDIRNCRDLALAGLTMGHTKEQGVCSGGVVNLSNCEGIKLESCRLYGCGTVGVDAYSSRAVALSFCEIYECSFGAVRADTTRQMRLDDCWVHDCGKSELGAGYQLFWLHSCQGFGLVNTRVNENVAMVFLSNEYSEGVEILGCLVEGNRLTESVFQLVGRSVLVEDCHFASKWSQRFYDLGDTGLFARDRNGEDLISFDLERMQRQRASYAGYTPPVPAEPDPEDVIIREDGTREIRVSSVDELLAAIAPNTTVILAAGDYDISSAANYGVRNTDWYSWEDAYDGFTLVITGADNFHLLGAGRATTRLLAVPRYADVLNFTGCEGIELADFTAGHTDGEGSCGGNVIELQNCKDVKINDCGFFGCGVVGVSAVGCSTIRMENTEMYACTGNGADFFSCRDVELKNCSIYGCAEGRDLIYVNDGKIIFDGKTLGEGIHLFDHHKYLGLQPTN